MQFVSETNPTLYVSAEKRNADDFSSVTEAVNSIPEGNRTPVTIFIAPGRYHEKITVNRPFVTLEGTGKSGADTVLTYDDYANDLMEDGDRKSVV